MSKNKQENKPAAWREKLAAQPLWLKLSFILGLLIIIQIAFSWDHFLAELQKGLNNYGITFFRK